jgi:hypothetical protein
MEEVYNSKGMTNADKEKKMYHDYHGFADDGTNGDERAMSSKKRNSPKKLIASRHRDQLIAIAIYCNNAIYCIGIGT